MATIMQKPKTATKMESSMTSEQFLELAVDLSLKFSRTASSHDETDSFVADHYALLKKNRVFSAMVPTELGGYGISHSDMCQFIRIIGRSCGSTALAMSMHQHLIAASVWKYTNKGEGRALLEKVAADQIVLVSTGARDWLESNGSVRKVEGGYAVTARKVFASQSAVGDILVTSAPYDDPEEGSMVLHFPVALKEKGVTLRDDWYTMGMRGTGSQTVELNEVFVPESAIALKRYRGDFHPVWNVILTVAMPLIMSAYVGIAEQAAECTIKDLQGVKFQKGHIPYSVGAMNNQLTIAKTVWADMLKMVNNYNFAPQNRLGHEILTRKTIVANACIESVQLAVDVVGGRSFFRKTKIERLFRDVQAAKFHPLPEKEQHLFSGSYLLRNT